MKIGIIRIMTTLIIATQYNSCAENISISRKVHSSEYYIKSGEYTKAIEKNRDALAIYDIYNMQGDLEYTDYEEICRIVVELIQLEYMTGGANALDMCFQALEIDQKTDCLQYENELIVRMVIAMLEAENGNIEIAESNSRKYIDKVEEDRIIEPESVEKLFYIRAYILAIQGRIANAIRLLEKAIEKYKDEEEMDTKYFADNLSALGELYRRSGENRLAERTLFKSLGILENIYGENHPSLVSTIESLAECFLAQKKIEESREMIKRKMRIEIEFGICSDSSYLRNLSIFSRIYLEENNLGISAKYLMRAIEFAEKRFGDNSIETAIIQRNLGILEYKKKRYNDAIGYITKSITTITDRLGKGHPDTVRMKMELVGIYLDIGNKEEAEKLILDLEETLDSGKIDKIEVVDEIEYIGEIYYELGKLDKSEEKFYEVVEIMNSMKDVSGIRILRTNIKICKLQNYQEKKNEYEDTIEKVEKNIENLLSDGDEDTVKVLIMIAGNQMSKGYLDISERMLRSIISRIEETLGMENDLTIDSHIILGTVMMKKKEFVDAEGILMKAYEVVFEDGERRDRKIRILKRLRRIYIETDRMEKAKEFDSRLEELGKGNENGRSSVSPL